MMIIGVAREWGDEGARRSSCNGNANDDKNVEEKPKSLVSSVSVFF